MQRVANMAPIRDGKALHVAPLFHAGALIRVFTQFMAGETHVIMPMFDARQMLETIERERVTEIALVPTMIQALVQHPDFARYDISSLKRLAYGAAPITAAVLEHALHRLPGVSFSQSYGLTEALIISSSRHEDHEAQARENGRYMSAGRANFGLAVKIVDMEDREVPRGTVGEIVVKGPSVTRGYWNKPKETARAFRDGWLHTGDCASMDADGYLYIVDRMKDMIVSGGENVYSAEVENVITRHPAVAACAVIGIPHAVWGESVHAVVVLRPGHAATAEDIRDFCRESIAGYKCPKSVDFRSELPLSAAGKILKHALRAPWKSSTNGPLIN
jgi:long-chain acyl-CoA synthetase